MWGPDIPPVGLTAQSALRQLLGALAGFATLALIIKNYGIPERPAVPREFPYDGLVKELGGVEELKVNFFSLNSFLEK
jgi:NADH dehydrogenase (ubiquinone) 1 beta subcomplex subunit 8